RWSSLVETTGSGGVRTSATVSARHRRAGVDTILLASGRRPTMVPAHKLFAVAQDEAPRGLTRDAWSVAGASPSDEEEQTTMRRGARVLVSATVLSLAVSDARAEILPYDNDTQRFGAAL